MRKAADLIKVILSNERPVELTHSTGGWDTHADTHPDTLPLYHQLFLFLLIWVCYESTEEGEMEAQEVITRVWRCEDKRASLITHR